ncbi:hypothetical protein V2J09_002079 [Rumex salicifolius]
MANSHHRKLSSSSSSSSSHSLLDDLYCVEEENLWEEVEEEKQSEMDTNRSLSLLPILMLEQKLFWDNDEILTLFSREQQISGSVIDFSSSLVLGRGEAVEWMLKVNSYYGFSTLTATLSINYLDKFLIRSPYLHHDNKPWTIQLAAVACLSLAAKVEEVNVPLLLDLQVAGAEYMFEAKSIQKMELLVLSTLDWKMHPVTAVSFLDHIIPRLGLKCNLHREFLRRSEQLLLSVIADSSALSYLPSVLATAIMMHVIDQIDPSNPLDYHNQLMGLLHVSKNCYEVLLENVSKSYLLSSGNKRTRSVNHEVPYSPNGVIDSNYFGSDSSTESWALGSSTSSSVSSSPHQHAMKRNKRVHEQYMPIRVFVDTVGGALN